MSQQQRRFPGAFAAPESPFAPSSSLPQLPMSEKLLLTWDPIDLNFESSAELQNCQELEKQFFSNHIERFIERTDKTESMSTIDSFRALEKRMGTIFEDKLEHCYNPLLMIENCREIRDEILRQGQIDVQMGQQVLAQQFSSIVSFLQNTTAPDVDTMEIHSAPEPIDYIALIQLYLNEGFARLSKDI
jgi:hypothetical protein